MKPRPPIGVIVFAGALVAGLVAAYLIALDGLTLAHYDARGHLIVARRLTDSLTPSWKQIGALWLPLPHVLNAIPVMWDWNYLTGFSAVAINVIAMAAGLGALSSFVMRQTGSVAASLTAPAIVLLNPAVLYLTATPMTEPLLFAPCLIALNSADKRLDGPEGHTPLANPGPWMALAVLTRYEAWPIAAALTFFTAISRPAKDRIPTFLKLGAWPATAAVAFLLFGRLTLGRFLADANFFTADNPAAHQPLVVLAQIFDGYVALGGWPLAIVVLPGLVWVFVTAYRRRSFRPLLPLALFAAVLLPFTAFLDGHPYRVRYMVALVAASGAMVGIYVNSLPWRGLRAGVAVVFVAVTLWMRPPLAANAPMVLEAQREAGTRADRGALTAYLSAHYDGRLILASMNSLGHYMQELSAIGLPLRKFIHAGNGDLWSAAIAHPERHAGWVLIEEAAEGGDELAALAKERRGYLNSFDRVAAGGGAALYKLR